MDSHAPYVPPPPFDTRFPGKDPSFIYSDYLQIQREVLWLQRGISSGERRHLTSQYDGGIAYMDSCIGALIVRLKQLGLYDNSLLVITSDHGEALGENSLVEHLIDSAYQNQIHVPLIIKYPHARRRAVVDEVVSHVDLMPTILDVAGLEPSIRVQGQSLLKMGRNGGRTVLAEIFPGGKWAGTHPRFKPERQALFCGTWKLIASTPGGTELYDFVKDPSEENNLNNPDADISRDLETKLAQMMNTFGKQPREPAKLDKRTVERLRSLGYVQ